MKCDDEQNEHIGSASIQFVVYGDPIAQPRAGERGDFKPTKYGGFYKEKYDPVSKKKLEFAMKCHQYKPETPLSGPMRVNNTWYFKRPKSHYGSYKGKPYLKVNAPRWYSLLKRNDRDNLDKFVLDALTSAGWFEDDGIICAGELKKLYTDKLPRTEIEIIPL